MCTILEGDKDFDKGEDRNVVENEDRENMKMVIKSEGFKVERGFEGKLEKEVENDRDGSEGKKSVGEEVVGFRVGGRQGAGKHKILSKLATQSFNILRLIARNPNFWRPKVPYFYVSRLSRLHEVISGIQHTVPDQ